MKCPIDMSKAVVDAVTTSSMAHQDLIFDDLCDSQRGMSQVSEDDEVDTTQGVNDESATVNHSVRDALIAELPVGATKTVSEYLTDLRTKLKDIHEYAERQEKYVAYYNRRAGVKEMKTGEQVIVLLPDSTNKLLSRWQGPGLIVDFKPPHSYLIELDGGQRRWYMRIN